LSDTNTTHSRLLSFTLDGWNVLGGQVSVSLENGVVVLVGRNGAGKSAILEGFKAISSIATGGRIGRNPPLILKIEISTPTNRHLEYTYKSIILNTSPNEPEVKPSFTWDDRCQYLDGEKELLWTTENGVTTFENGGNPIITVLGNTSSLQRTTLPENSPVKLPIEMQWIRTTLNEVHLLGKIPARTTSERQEAAPSTSNKFIYSDFDLINQLFFKILRLMKTNELHELESVCQRVGIGNKIAVEKLFIPSISREHAREYIEGTDYFFIALLDDINIGLLSDGTLRILYILVEIINLNPSATIIIEEPETQIHPGMLARLLNEIEAYTFDKNLILSTHSPQVVAWTSPENINLVHRKDGQTFVRKLNEDEIHNVIEYISDEGDLGEWIYSGVLDE
jgi:energy-coupling factor transporter ATP-binding protein EcfA2